MEGRCEEVPRGTEFCCQTNCPPYVKWRSPISPIGGILALERHVFAGLAVTDIGEQLGEGYRCDPTGMAVWEMLTTALFSCVA